MATKTKQKFPQKTWQLKSCPRCGGDLFVDEDFGHIVQRSCLQCGNRIYRKAGER